MPLARALQGDSVVVSDEFLIRLNAHVGDTLRLGERDFRITAVLEQEPDRISETMMLGPRVMISQASLDSTKLLAPGSRASRRLLFKFPATPPRGLTANAQATAVTRATGSGAAGRAGDRLPRKQFRPYERPR
jgi:putative ABC transport system permease protein